MTEKFEVGTIVTIINIKKQGRFEVAGNWHGYYGEVMEVRENGYILRLTGTKQTAFFNFNQAKACKH